MCEERCFPVFVLELYCKNMVEYGKAHTGTVSVSAISTCLRKAFYEKTQPYFTSVISVTSAVRGTMMHESLQRFFVNKPGALSEYKVSQQYSFGKVTGTLDLWYCEILYDFKSSKVIRPSYSNQLNTYRQLCNRPVKKMKIILLDRFEAVTVPAVDVDVEGRARTLVESLSTKTPPPPEDQLGACQYCYFLSQCAGKATVICGR